MSEWAYEGPFTFLVMAQNQVHAEDLLKRYLARKNRRITMDDADPTQYTVSKIPRRPGVTDVS